MTPTARVLGRYIRLGYLLVSLVLATGLFGAALQFHQFLGVYAHDSALVNAAGRQSYLGAQAVAHAMASLVEASRSAGPSTADALIRWSTQQTAVEAQLGNVCDPKDSLCTDFHLLKQQQRALAALCETLPPAALREAEVSDRVHALDSALRIYLIAADRWVDEFSDRLNQKNVWQQGRLWLWSLLMIAACGAIVAAVIEPNLRRLQRQRSDFDGAARERRRLAAVAETTHHAVAILDLNRRIEWVNAGFVQLTGYAADTACGATAAELLNGPETSGEAIEKMAHGIAQGTGYQVDVVHYKANGAPYWGSVDCRPIRDDAGQVYGFIVIEADITGAATELATAHLRLKTATQAANIGVWEWAIGTDELWLDAIGCRLLGVAENAPAVPWDRAAELIVEEDRSRFPAALQEMLAGKDTATIRFRTRDAGDGIHHLLVIGSLERVGGRVRYLRGVLLDESATIEVNRAVKT